MRLRRLEASHVILYDWEYFLVTPVFKHLSRFFLAERILEPVGYIHSKIQCAFWFSQTAGGVRPCTRNTEVVTDFPILLLSSAIYPSLFLGIIVNFNSFTYFYFHNRHMWAT